MVIYMSDSKQIKPEDLVRIFKSQNILTPCILITDTIEEISDENITKFGNYKSTVNKACFS